MTLDELERKLEGVPTGLLKKLVARREGKKVSKTKKRYEITGVWNRTGNIHLRYYTDSKQYVDSIKELHHITFGDGTQLNLNVREMGYGEKK